MHHGLAPLMEQRIELSPNCSLSPAGARLFFGATCLFSLAFCMIFVVMGFWPVLPFWALEMLVLGFALAASMRHHRLADQAGDPIPSRRGKTRVCAALGEG